MALILGASDSILKLDKSTIIWLPVPITALVNMPDMSVQEEIENLFILQC
jgi:hypothetical protein